MKARRVGLPEVYRLQAARFMAVVGALDAERQGAPVPACPGWSVHDLLAHQAGSSTDLVRGVVAGVATPPWTARQVEDRRDTEVPGLVGEWSANVEAVARTCDGSTPSPAWDVTAHLDDLREAVGLEPVPADQGWGEVLEVALAFLRQRGGVTVSVAEDGPDPGTTTWHLATTYGLWRGLFSRLDRDVLRREVLRGDLDAFAAAAFFSS